MKKLFWLLSLLLALGVALAGCGGEEAGSKSGDTAPENLLFVYWGAGGEYGLARTDGSLAVEPGDYDWAIFSTPQGVQSFALQQTNLFDMEQVNQFGQPLLLERTFNFYNAQGELQKTTRVQLDSGGDESDIQFCPGADGSLENSRILINELSRTGRYRLLDTDGVVLVDCQAVEPESWRYAYAYVTLAEGFMAVNCSFSGEDWLYNEQRLDFYTPEGEPMETAQAYFDVWQLYDSVTQRDSGYYLASYQTPQGRQLTDVLDAQGGLVLSELSRVDSVNGGLFVVTKGFEHGIMNAAGEWVYRESNFSELED